jgi:hypothetical protein
MNPTDEPEDKLKSTLMIKAVQAMTFSEIEAFVHDLETRPLDRFIEDLPSLITLPEAKFALVAMVYRKRFNAADEAARKLLEGRIMEIVDSAETDEANRTRCRALLEPS